MKKQKEKPKNQPKQKEQDKELDREIKEDFDFGGFPKNVDLKKNMGCGG